MANRPNYQHYGEGTGLSGDLRQGHAYCADGQLRRVDVRDADSFYTCPASVRVAGKHVSGFITLDTDGPLPVVLFHASRAGVNYGLLRGAPRDADRFVAGYVSCALWADLASIDADDEHEPTAGLAELCDAELGDRRDGERFASWMADYLAPEARTTLDADARAFFCDQHEDLHTAIGYRPGLVITDHTWEQLGHDFWLTRNGHGAGYWDRGLGELGDRLADAARAHGTAGLYVGDDGLVHHE